MGSAMTGEETVICDAWQAGRVNVCSLAEETAFYLVKAMGTAFEKAAAKRIAASSDAERGTVACSATETATFFGTEAEIVVWAAAWQRDGRARGSAPLQAFRNAARSPGHT